MPAQRSAVTLALTMRYRACGMVEGMNIQVVRESNSERGVGRSDITPPPVWIDEEAEITRGWSR
jgi:hypothetical protein